MQVGSYAISVNVSNTASQVADSLSTSIGVIVEAGVLPVVEIAELPMAKQCDASMVERPHNPVHTMIDGESSPDHLASLLNPQIF